MKQKFIDKNISITNDIYDRHILDETNWFGDVPPFTNIEFNICSMCNRKCFFCPKSNHTLFPNEKKYLSLELYEKIMIELKSVAFKGRISLCGLSEPFLHKGLIELVKITKKHCPDSFLDILTNGDYCNEKNIQELFVNGLDNLKISMYDGPDQIEFFEQLKNKVQLTDEQFVMRPRYLSSNQDFGLTINNRGGTVNLKEYNIIPLDEPLKSSCYYPFHKVVVDFDGDVMICPNDWQKKYVAGNLMKESIFDIWNGLQYKQVRLRLINKDRSCTPCNQCDVEGTLYAKLHFEAWKDYYR